MASWLLSPLCVACTQAVDAADAFLWFLTVSDAGFKRLLQVGGWVREGVECEARGGGGGLTSWGLGG
jgi:hypothetical protein